jgi:hypothetical protein
LLKGSSGGWVEYAGESEWVSGTQIAFDGPDMIRQRSFVFGHITPAPGPAVLFIHPRNYAQRASRRQPKLFAQLGYLHCDCSPSSVINRTRAKVPGIKMT